MRPVLNAKRLLEDIDRLSKIGGRTDGGVTRLAFSDMDRAGRDLVEDLLRELGLETRIDTIGNLAAVLPGRDPSAGIVFAGSHTDTVGEGGRYDGALGVLAAIAAIRAVVEAGYQAPAPLGVISFVNEEGVRFMPDMMGSLFVRGDLETEAVRAAIGIDGTTVGSELVRTGMVGTDDFRSLPVRAFVELHIEQGPELETSGRTIGVVTGVQGLRWLRVQLSGAANHAGTTPMSMRRDAGLAASRIAAGIRLLCSEIDGLRGTVGSIRLEPNLVNVVPGRATLTIDLRHPDPDRLSLAESRARDLIASESERESVQAIIDVLADAPPVTFDPIVVSAVEEATEACGYSFRRMISGAGHDAQIMSHVWPAGMIFIPSRDGVSHSPEEYSAPDDIVAGARVLLDTMIRLAEQDAA